MNVDEAESWGSEVRVFEGAGHLPMLERPAEFRATLDEFLERCA